MKLALLAGLFLAGFVLLGAVGCSTASVRVLPGENGVHQVISKDIEQEDAEEEAVKAAEKYCKRKEREAVFLKSKSEYKGSMNEGDRKTIRKASKATSWIPGAGVVGAIGSTMTSDRDYTSALKFKCKVAAND